ncbi:MAG TPA: carbonic anhydrase family protein [Terracidiphilus sp.]|nr:carbonic anhydrase family protein [Terracidiphilus sp.]
MMRFERVAALVFVAATVAAAQSGAPWDYRGKQGPVNWGKLDPAYRACSQGHEQSPVDIRGAHLDKNLAALQFHFIAGPVTLINDGRTITLQVYPGSTMVADGVTYELKNLTFHRPSENAVKGKLTDMDAELLFRSTDGKMAVVATRMLLDWGEPNATIATLWEHLPTKAGTSEKIADMVNPGGLLPADPGYWTFMGSLSTPPCTEGVRWFVFQTPITISRAQLSAYTDIFSMDSRPLQEMHGRKVSANE